MAQLDTLKLLISGVTVADAVLQFYLDSASDIICELRNSDVVETKYINIQTKMAVEMVNKMGAEGQTAHSENGIARTYELGDISASLLAQITPMGTTPISVVRVVNV